MSGIPALQGREDVNYSLLLHTEGSDIPLSQEGTDPVLLIKSLFARWAYLPDALRSNVLIALWAKPITGDSPMAFIHCSSSEMPDVLVSLLKSVGAPDVQ